MLHRANRKSGQAIIFLMVVIVIGLFIVIWNYDLLRVINAKIRVRNATDAAALAGARWQGVTLNMIGDLNLVQAAVLADAIEEQAGLPQFEVPGAVSDLHDLRNRLAFIGPLAAFEIAQQAAFDNGAVRDPRLEANLMMLAELLRKSENQGAQPYDNACENYADLLDRIATNGAAVSSYTLPADSHAWKDKKFYAGIGQALAGKWCGLQPYLYELENYPTLADWPPVRTDAAIYYPLNLKLSEFVSRTLGEADYTINWPGIALTTNVTELQEYYENDERGTFANHGADSSLGLSGMYPFRPTEDILWHVFGSAWEGTWPEPRAVDDELEDDEEGDLFPLRSAIEDKYNYLGAEAGFSMATPVHRGILASSTKRNVGLVYKAKAKPFGYIIGELGDSPPYYFGYVFPVFTDVRLVHSDIGDKFVDSEFYNHIEYHLAAYNDGGKAALDPDCRYCRLLSAYDDIDHDEGVQWLKDAEESDDDPCEQNGDSGYGLLRGGASGGS